MDSRKDEALHELARNEYERRQSDPDQSTTRRNLLRLGAGTAAGALLFGSATGSASAQSTSGTIPVSSDPAFTKFRGDRIRLVPRTSPVSNPSDGLITYRSDL